MLPKLNLLKKAMADGYAVPSFCVWNAETAITVLGVAADLRVTQLVNQNKGSHAMLPKSVLGG